MDRPSQQISQIITSVINSVNLSSIIRTFRSTLEERCLLQGDDVLVILEGRIKAIHKDTGVLLGELNGPYIIKLVPNIIYENYAIAYDSHFSYLTCPRSDFFALIEEQQLWRSLYYVLSYSSTTLSRQLEVMRMNSLYDVVKYYLGKIECDKVLKETENVCNYITSRTGYSRSGVMSIIRELRKGGYIEIERGKLVWIKQLPQGF